MNFNNLQTNDERLQLMSSLAANFASRAAQYDEEGSFPVENIKELVNTGYTTLTIPKEYGGKEISLLEMLQLQEKIAEGDGATALSIGWHVGTIKNLSEKRVWKEEMFQTLCQEVMSGKLINTAASENQTGSPTRGGRPVTTAEKVDHGWIINGRKSYTSMIPMLDYIIVSAGIKDQDEVGNFLLSRSQSGIDMEETWDSIAMRGTASHDLVLQNVFVSDEHYVEVLVKKKKAMGWLLHIPACYLGIAQAAQNEALHFASSYSPNSISGTILELPNVKQKIGEMEFELMRARHFLYYVAEKWDQASDAERDLLVPQLGAVKVAVTNAAQKVVDLAMRVVGARSLSQKSPLQRYYRDVRAGLHNPPMDDMVIEQLANAVIEKSSKQST